MPPEMLDDLVAQMVSRTADRSSFGEEPGRRKAREADYMDMHDSMGELVEEAQKKTADAEKQIEELLAQLKVKDAEIAEAKVCAFPNLRQQPGCGCDLQVSY